MKSGFDLSIQVFLTFRNENKINAVAQSVDIFIGPHVFGAKTNLEQKSNLKPV